MTLPILLGGNGLDTIRSLAQNSDSILNDRSSIENTLRILIILPSATALEPLTAIDFWLGKRDKRLFVICIIIVVLRVVVDAGRTPLVNFLMYMLIGYFLTATYKMRKKTWHKRRKKWMNFVIISFGGIVLYFTTMSRDGMSTLKNIYYYFAMAPYMDAVWSGYAYSRNLIGYGAASLNGFIFPILYLVKNIFGISFPDGWLNIYNLVLQTDSQWQAITTTGITANAYVSLFWFFYLDGRIVGIILGMFFYGMIMAHFYVKAMISRNIKKVCVFALLFQGLFFSFIRFPFTNIYYSIAFLFLMLLFYKKKDIT
jgi:oligosaccharide repeat unit polymerase